MTAYQHDVKFIPDSAVRFLGGHIDIEIFELGVSAVKTWPQRQFVADPFFRLYYICEGTTSLLFDDGAVKLCRGDLCLIPANIPFRYVSRSVLHHYWVHFCSRSLEGIPYFQRFQRIAGNRARESLSVMKKIYELADTGSHLASIMQMDIYTRQLLYAFIEKIPENELLFWHTRQGMFSPVIEYVDRHIGATIPIKELALLVGMGCNAFSLAFKQAFAVTPKHYITNRRIEHSKVLLLRTKQTIRSIALQVGYENEFYFYRIFKKYTKMTPDKYRCSRNICL